MNDTMKIELREACTVALAENRDLKTPVTFYSKACAGLVLCGSKGRIIAKDRGGERRVGQKMISFTPIHSVQRADKSRLSFGFFETKDPELVLSLLDYMVAKDDVISAEEYAAMVTPHDIQMSVEKARRIDSENRLDRVLAENEELKRRLASAAVPQGKGKDKEPVGATA